MVMLSKDKLPGLKSVELDFYEDCVYGKQKWVSFSTMSKIPKAEKLELVHNSSLSRRLIVFCDLHRWF